MENVARIVFTERPRIAEIQIKLVFLLVLAISSKKNLSPSQRAPIPN